MKYTTILFSLFFLVLSSCEKEYTFKGQPSSPKLVVYSFIEPDSTIEVYISQTRGIGQSDRMYEAREVSGEIYIDDRYRARLVHLENHRYTSGIKARKGERIRLSVRAKGVKEISAETTIPSTSPSISVDTTALFRPNRSGILIGIKETDRQQRFYRFILQEDAGRILYNHTLDSTLYETETVYDNFNKDNEPLLTNRNNDLLPGDNDDANIYNIFPNHTFRGQSYNLQIDKILSPSYEYEIHYLQEGEKATKHISNRYTFKICQLNEDAYLYLKSAALVKGSPALFADPVKVYSNVENGLGVVGGFTTSSVSCTGPTKKLEPVDTDSNPFHPHSTTP